MISPFSIRLRDIALERDYRAAYVVLRARFGSATFHDHDFHEVMWVLAGSGAHRVADRLSSLQAGDLVLVRPSDRHRVEPAPQGRLDFVNLAVRSGLWTALADLAGFGPAARSWDERGEPPLVRVDEPERSRLTADVDLLLQADRGSGDNVELLRCLGTVLRLLAGGPPALAGGDEPDWLRRACRAMHEPDNLRAGYDRLLRLSGVSEGHLARSLRRHRGQTPVQFVTELRLRRAATLLESTGMPVGEVALEAGFDNLSYFHRSFRSRFGSTPRAFRAGLRRLLTP